MAITGLALGAVAAVTSLFVTIVFDAALGSVGDYESRAPTAGASVEAAAPTPTPEETAVAVAESAAPAEPATPVVPAEHATALIKAETYANSMDTSKAGRYDQLTSEYGEKFTAEEADYATAHLDD